MDFFSLCLSGIAVALLISVIKDVKSELVLPMGIAFSVIALYYILPSVKAVFQSAEQVFLSANADTGLVSGAIKVCGLSFIAELVSSLLCDSGHTAIAGKIELCAKITIILLAVPILSELCSTVFELI